MLLPSLGTSLANVALPTLRAAFGASHQEVQWVVIAYLLAITSLAVTAGRLGGLLGRRRLLLGGSASSRLPRPWARSRPASGPWRRRGGSRASARP